MSPLEKLKRTGKIIGIIYAVMILLFLLTRHNESIDWAYLFTLYNAIIVFVLLYLGLKEPIGKTLDSASERVAKSLREAQIANESTRQFEMYREEIMAQLEDEKTQLTSSFTAQISNEKERIISDAQKEAKQIIADITKNSEVELARIKDELRRRFIAEAFSEAESLMRDKISATDKERVFKNLVAEIAGEK